MRTFRITLSHGDEHITFDGAGARSGSMFHVRRDAIKGLWSSPASKVSLTERETANGASPISDGETLYAARTVVIPFAIQSNYNHADLIRARTMLGRLIGWHDVRMDIYDDGDETVLFGYVEAKYSDIPYDHADTGTITLVCPDPRRVSKHASTVTMNTSSSSLGGLSFGVLAYKTSWLGTPDASLSGLVQDDTVIVINWVTDPNALQELSTWSPVGSTTAAQRSDGHWVYTPSSDVTELAFSIPIEPIVSDDYVYCEWLGGTGDGYLENMDTVAHGNGWILGKNTGLAGNRRFFPALNGTPITILKVGKYGAGGYADMQSRGIRWFDGDSQSPKPNAGLVFPLDFGQTGNTGNTGMITNNGSYTSMPTITAHGNLDNGFTIHWNTSDGNEGDLSYKGSIQNVPVIINTDSHSAIMGGLDVSYQLGSRDWPRIPAGGSCSFALLASGDGWVTVQSHDTYM